MRKLTKGFTLIELLVVIAIIGVLSSVVLVSLDQARSRARDTQRLAEMKQIQTALELYRLDNNRYPESDRDGCGNWDVGNQDRQLFRAQGMDEYTSSTYGDPVASGNCAGYRYYRYPAGASGCDPSQGAFYVLGITNIESVSGPHPDSPGWSCPGRNWQSQMEWVTGQFER